MTGAREDSGFRPRGRVDEPLHRVDRDVARGAHRVFRAADGFVAIVAEQVIERAVAIGRAREPLEWMGLLVGRVCEDARGRYALVLGMVLDREATAGRHEVHSSTASEAATRVLARDLFPDCVAIGWIHGHVRHGVHFSPADRENQRSWRRPHAVGIVVDPWSRDLLGVYRGPESERLAPSPAEAPRPAIATPTRAVLRPRRPRPRRLATWRHLIVGALALVAAAAGNATGRARALAARVAHLERARTHPATRVVQVVVVPVVAPPAPEAPPESLACTDRPAPEALLCPAPPFSWVR